MQPVTRYGSSLKENVYVLPRNLPFTVQAEVFGYAPVRLGSQVSDVIGDDVWG